MSSLNPRVPMPKIDYKKVKEVTYLLWINFLVTLKNSWETFKVILKYYPKLNFLKTDVGLLLTYLFDNPFRISKRFLIKEGNRNIYQYGETPLTTLEEIMQEADVSSRDTIFELGAGRGRSSFWLSQVLGSNVVAVEKVPDFVKRARRIKQKTGAERVTFREEDLLKTDLTGATVVYLYGTCYEDDFIGELNSRLSTLPAGTKLITVSYPLTDYANSAKFEVMKRFTASFTWGQGDVYLHVIKD